MLNAALAENDGDEVHARRLEEGRIGGVRQMLDIYAGDIADNIVAVVDDSNARQAFGVHQGQRVA